MAQQITPYVMKNGAAQIAEFGCNGAKPQGPFEVSAAVADSEEVSAPTTEEFNGLVALVNELRAALVANGICVAAPEE